MSTRGGGIRNRVERERRAAITRGPVCRERRALGRECVRVVFRNHDGRPSQDPAAPDNEQTALQRTARVGGIQVDEVELPVFALKESDGLLRIPVNHADAC